jgi:hypothetical protein
LLRLIAISIRPKVPFGGSQPSHSITSSARNRNASETARPSALAGFEIDDQLEFGSAVRPEVRPVATTIKQYRFRQSICSFANAGRG